MAVSPVLANAIATKVFTAQDARELAGEARAKHDTAGLRRAIADLRQAATAPSDYRTAGGSGVDLTAVAWLERYATACENVLGRSLSVGERCKMAYRHFWPALPSKLSIAACGVGASMLAGNSAVAGVGGMLAGFYALLGARMLLPPVLLPDPARVA